MRGLRRKKSMKIKGTMAARSSRAAEANPGPRRRREGAHPGGAEAAGQRPIGHHDHEEGRGGRRRRRAGLRGAVRGVVRLGCGARLLHQVDGVRAVVASPGRINLGLLLATAMGGPPTGGKQPLPHAPPRPRMVPHRLPRKLRESLAGCGGSASGGMRMQKDGAIDGEEQHRPLDEVLIRLFRRQRAREDEASNPVAR